MKEDLYYDSEAHLKIREIIDMKKSQIEKFIISLNEGSENILSYWKDLNLNYIKSDRIYIDLVIKQTNAVKRLLNTISEMAQNRNLDTINTKKDPEFDPLLRKEFTGTHSDQVDYGSMTPHYRIDDPIPTSCCIVECNKPWINCLRIEEVETIFFSCYEHFSLLFDKGSDLSKHRDLSISGVDYVNVDIWRGSLPVHDFADFIMDTNVPQKMEKVKALRQSGLSWSAIAKELNITINQLRKWRKKHMPDSFK